MAFKFDDLIAQVKAKIPPNLLGKFASKGGASGEAEGTHAAKTLTNTEKHAEQGEKTQSRTQPNLQTEGKPAIDPKVAKRSKIIKIGVGIAIVFFAADEFLNTEKPAEAPKQTAAVKKVKKEPEKAIETPPPELAQATPEPTAPSISTPVAEVAPPESTPAVMPTEAPPQVAQSEVPQEPEKIEEKIPENTTPIADATAVSSPQTSEVPDRTPSGGENFTAESTNTDPTSFQIGETAPVDQVKDPTVPTGSIDKVVDELDKQKILEYVAPPSYEELGRGLVYNCKGKHWACLNKDAYFVCRDNMKWNAAHSKPTECSTINVYATNEDCELIQLHNINTREKTDFCQ